MATCSASGPTTPVHTSSEFPRLHVVCFVYGGTSQHMGVVGMQMRLVIAVGAALVVSGCGGSDDDASTEDPATNAAPEPADDGAEPAAEPAASGGLNRATITVGDQTYDFEWETSSIQLCDPDFFGGFVAIAATTTDADSFDVELAEEGTPGFEDRAPRIEVSDAETGVNWTADPQETLGTTFESWPAQVDSFELDGNRASGTATFVGETAFDEEPVGVPGTFEVTCSG